LSSIGWNEFYFISFPEDFTGFFFISKFYHYRYLLTSINCNSSWIVFTNITVSSSSTFKNEWSLYFSGLQC
jgi:hypothetical protein